MILLLASALALGVLLVASPLLWPVEPRPERHPFGPTRILRERMRQAGLGSVPIPVFIVVALVIGLAVGALVFVIVPVVPLAVVAGIAALAAPSAVIGVRARAQRKIYRAIWPDVVDHIVSTTRSGIALPDGVAALAHIGPTVTREAFGVFESEYAATGHFGRSLDELKDQLSDPTADRILETLRMSRDVGGSELPSVLRALAAHLRQEAAIRGEVEARQSWVMNAARLGALAPWVILLLLSTRPEAAVAYNSPAGAAVIIGGLISTVVAYRLMIALARLPEERRWFR